MPTVSTLSRYFASVRVTRTQPWLAGRAGTLFETPMVGAPPEDLAYIP